MHIAEVIIYLLFTLFCFILLGKGISTRSKWNSIIKNKDRIKNVQIVGRHNHYRTGYIGRSANPGRCTKVKVISTVDFHMRVNYKDGTSELLSYIPEKSSFCRALAPYLLNPEKLHYDHMRY